MAPIPPELALTDEQLDEMMTSSWNMRVATIGPGTRINVTPLWFGWAGGRIYFSECGVRYVLGLLEHALANGAAAVDVRRDVHDAFNERVDAENRVMAWGWSEVNSWYKNEHGHVAQNWPFTLLEYWQRTLAPDPDDYVVS